MNARTVVAVVVALVVGLVLGGLGPRAQVRALTEQVAELKARPAQRRTGEAMSSLFRGRPFSDAQKQSDPPTEPPTERIVVRAPVDPSPIADPDAPEGSIVASGRDQIDQMRDAMDIRRAQAEAALREQARPSEAQMATIDTVVEVMNEELRGLAEAFVAVSQEGEPSRSELMRFAKDTMDVLIEAEDSIYGTLAPDQRRDLSDEVLDPTAFVDGSIVELFAELDGG